jgi:hypothetical protein
MTINMGVKAIGNQNAVNPVGQGGKISGSRQVEQRRLDGKSSRNHSV